MKKMVTASWIAAMVLLLSVGAAGGQTQAATPVEAKLESGGTSAEGSGGGQVKDDLFAGTEKFAQGASDVTEVNLDPSMLGMVGGKKGGGDLAKKMNFMTIHSYTYPKAGMYRMEDVEVYRKKLTDGSWSCAIHVKDKSGTTDICTRAGKDHESNEMVILAAEPMELTFIHMSGKMSLEDLSKMSGGAGDGLKKR